jgi:hypothetical protein
MKYFALFLTFAWFYQAGGWNQNSRFDLVRAIVEERTLRIDDYHRNTGDKARWDGHYYSDKAPGLALAAVPAVAAARPFTADVAWLSWLATLWTAALPTALAALLLHGAARRLGASEGGATFAALAFALATPAWAYATLFFGHALATFCLVGAFAAAVALPRSSRPLLLGFAVGLCVGWGTLTEFPTAPPGLLVCGFALAQAGSARWRVAAGIAAGGLLAFGVLVAYNVAAFGGPFQTGYTHIEGWSGMKEGFMGVTWPKLDVLGQITFGGYRGLFFFAPVLLFAPIGWLSGPRRAGAIGAAIVVYYLLFNAAYKYWSGGWSFGPRHLAPALPFLALPLAFVWSRGRAPLRAALIAAAIVAGGIQLVAVATTAQPPENVRHPLGDLLWPAFRDGDLSLNHQSFLDVGADPARLRGGSIPHDAWNLGEKLGLRGLSSLAPLAGVWAACLAWERFRRRRGASPARTAAPPR